MGFSGDLADMPLQDILHILSRHGKSGQLTLTTESHHISLIFDRGTAVSVTTSDGSLRIGQLLVAQGYVTEEQIERALGLQSVNQSSARLGDLLVDVGYVTREQIQSAVNAQLEASIFRILMQSGGTFTFTPSDEVSSEPIVSGVSLDVMLLNAMRLADEWQSVDSGTREIVLADTLVDSSEIDNLDESERKLVMAILNGASTTDMIALRSGLSASDFGSALDGLRRRGLIGVRTRSGEQPQHVNTSD